MKQLKFELSKCPICGNDDIKKVEEKEINKDESIESKYRILRNYRTELLKHVQGITFPLTKQITYYCHHCRCIIHGEVDSENNLNVVE